MAFPEPSLLNPTPHPADAGTLRPDPSRITNLPEVKELARVCKCLGDEQRLRILVLLLERGELHVSAIGEFLGQSQPAISHHLNQLKSIGLISYRRSGKFNHYKVSSEGWQQLLTSVFPQGSPFQTTLDSLTIQLQWHSS